MMHVQLFHLKTDICTFHIRAPESSFKITLHTWQDREYGLYADDNPEPIATYPEPYGACRAVAEHRTGYDKWDSVKISTSDYILDWTCDVDDRFKIQLVSNYLETAPDSSYYEFVDYFEYKHGYLLDRNEAAELYKDLIMTGQTKVKLSDWMTPSELSDMPEITESWLADDSDTESGS